MNLQETSDQILQIGDKVRMNIPEIAKGDMDGVEITNNGTNYWRYMNQHPDEIYTVTGYDFTPEETAYILSGTMSGNTWFSNELILIPEPKSNFEIIKSMTVEEMSAYFVRIFAEKFQDIKSMDQESMTAWLLSEPLESLTH